MILIAIGTNLPTSAGSAPIDTCRAAVPMIRAIPNLTFIAVSSWYRTTPIPRADQAEYCNGVVRLQGEIDPAAMLQALHDIEVRFGRVRAARNAPRTLDLDLIDVNGIVRATPAPILPHPRAHERAFVLRPILDVAPAWRHPVLRQSVSTLLAELPPQGILPWAPDEG